MSQAGRVLNYLKTGKVLNRMIAFTELGMWEAPARISELRSAGYRINTEMEEVTNRFNETSRIAHWTLISDDGVQV